MFLNVHVYEKAPISDLKCCLASWQLFIVLRLHGFPDKEPTLSWVNFGSYIILNI